MYRFLNYTIIISVHVHIATHMHIYTCACTYKLYTLHLDIYIFCCGLTKKGQKFHSDRKLHNLLRVEANTLNTSEWSEYLYFCDVIN